MEALYRRRWVSSWSMSLGLIWGPRLEAILVLGMFGTVDGSDLPVAAAHVDILVSHVSGGDEVGDHLHAQVVPARRWGHFDHFAVDERSGGHIALGGGGVAVTVTIAKGWRAGCGDGLRPRPG